MKRRPLHLVLSAAELLRFLALMFLVSGMASLGHGTMDPSLFRYAASSQLLFVAAFFFMWLDQARYGEFGKLVALGKVVCLAAYIPMIVWLWGTYRSLAAPMLELGSVFGPGLVILAVDVAGFVVALEPRGHWLPGKGDGGRNGREPPRGGGSGPSAPSGQGPDDVEEVEA